MHAYPPGSGAFAQTLEARLEGERLVMDAGPEHLNLNGVVHGGVLMSLLDMAMATAVGATLGPEERAASIELGTHFLAAARPGRLVATGRVVRRGRTLAFAEGEVQDADGKPLARGKGIWAITPKRAGA